MIVFLAKEKNQRIKQMKKAVYFCILAMVFLSCSTTLGELHIYDISAQVSQASEKKANPKAQKTYGVIFSANQPYDSTNIFRLDEVTLRSKPLPNTQWATKPREMLSTTLSSLMNAKGLNVVKQPFGGAKVQKILKMHIARLLIIRRGNGSFAHITLDYEVVDSKTLNVEKSLSITKEAPITEDFAPVFLRLSSDMLQEVVERL